MFIVIIGWQLRSPSIRNHSFLLTDTARIKYNIKNPDKPISKKLDLGRLQDFLMVLQDSTLLRYDSIGAPVDGAKYQISAFTKNIYKNNGIM